MNIIMVLKKDNPVSIIQIWEEDKCHIVSFKSLIPLVPGIILFCF